jgi:hypothetical protein
VAYRFGFDYREASLKEEGWQARLYARHPGHGTGEAGGVKLTRYYPRYPDTERGARESWRARREVTPFLYLESRSKARREPTAEETRWEEEGWVAGYLESVRRHPGAR